MLLGWEIEQQRLLIGESGEAEGMLHPADETGSVEHVPDLAVFEVDAHGKAMALDRTTVGGVAGHETENDLRRAVLWHHIDLEAKSNGIVGHDQVADTLDREILESQGAGRGGCGGLHDDAHIFRGLCAENKPKLL